MIWGVPIQDSDWRDGDSIRPEWLPIADYPEDAGEGFEDVFMSLRVKSVGVRKRGDVDYHTFSYCGEYDTRTIFVGVVLWKATWYGESPALEPTDEQRAAVAEFLASVRLDRVPAVHALLSFG